MKAAQPSITAQNNAAVRAFEAMRPAAQRICHDPFARYFMSEELCRAADPKQALSRMICRWNLLVPGVCDAILARTRFVDEHLLEALDNGLQQLVILGAGYDTRTLRFEQLQTDTAVFELDHPATQQVKLQRLRKHRLPVSDRVTFLPCRFDQQDFTAALLDGGYDPSRTTFFIWEGVSYYLLPADVDRILAFIVNLAPDGSAVVFDYFPPSVADGSCTLEEAANLRQALRQMGEKITFGIDPEAIEDFLSARGLVLKKNFSRKDIRDTYLKKIDRPASVSAMFHFAVAAMDPG